MCLMCLMGCVWVMFLGVNYAIIQKLTEDEPKGGCFDRSDKRFVINALSVFSSPFMFIGLVSFMLTRKGIGYNRPEVERLRSEVGELKSQNADLQLKHAELDGFVRELRSPN